MNLCYVGQDQRLQTEVLYLDRSDWIAPKLSGIDNVVSDDWETKEQLGRSYYSDGTIEARVLS